MNLACSQSVNDNTPSFVEFIHKGVMVKPLYCGEYTTALHSFTFDHERIELSWNG